MPRLDRALPKTVHKVGSQGEVSLTPAAPASMPTSVQRGGQVQQARAIPRSATLIEPFQLVPRTPPLVWPGVVQTLGNTASRGLARLAACVDRQRRFGLTCLLVTSCARGEGRTTLAMCLARHLGEAADTRILLVDADFSKPRLASRLRLRVEMGLDDVLLDHRPLGGALLESLTDGVTLLPLRRSLKEPALIGDAHRLTRVFGCLRDAFDLVVIDGAPLFTNAEWLIAQPDIEHALLVVDRGISSMNDVERGIRRLTDFGIHVLGAVENFA